MTFLRRFIEGHTRRIAAELLGDALANAAEKHPLFTRFVDGLNDNIRAHTILLDMQNTRAVRPLFVYVQERYQCTETFRVQIARAICPGEPSNDNCPNEDGLIYG